MAEAAESADGCADSIDEFGNKTKDVGGAVDTLAGALAAAGVAATIKEIAETLMECVKAAESYEVALAKLSTLADTNTVSMGELSSEVQRLSNEMGVSASALSEAAYQALSSGIETANVVEFVTQATQLSKAGFTESAVAVDVLTTALNAYGLEATQTERIASMLVMTQDLGKTSVDQLAESMGKVIPSAAAYNVQIDNLSASYAILTRNGINTRNATTYLSGMLDELATAGSEVADIIERQTGKSFSDLMASGSSLGDVIEILSGSVDGNATAFSNLWSNSTAAKGALTLFNTGAVEFDNVLTQMQNSTGKAAENFAIMADTAQNSKDRMTAAMENLKIAIGQQLSPALEGLYKAGSGAFSWAADFINENPWMISVISGLTAALGALAAAVAGLVIVKKVIPAILEFNAALGMNPAIAVAAAIVGLVTVIATMVPSSDEAATATKRLTDRLQESKKAYAELTGEVEAQREGTQNLVTALADALDVEEKSEAQKAAILNLVEDLNEAMPDLALYYEEASGSIGMTTDALREMAEAAAQQEENDAKVARLSELYTEQALVADQLRLAEENLAAVREAGAEANIEYVNLGAAGVVIYDNTAMAASVAAKEVETLTQASADLANEIQLLDSDISAYIEETKASQAATAEMQAIVSDLTAEMQALEEQYAASQEKAYESITSQLGLFEELDGTAKTSIGNLIDTLSGQIDYMNTYAENIQRAMELGVDEGLVQKLADGSEQSAQILAAIVQGGGEDIAALNEKLAQVEEGKQKFSTSVAEMETDFSEKMTDLEARIEQTVEELDVSAEAMAAGVATLKGYIDGAESMRDELVSAYRSLAKEANRAFKSELDINSPSRVFEEHGKNTVAGLVLGVEEGESDLVQAIDAMCAAAVTAMERAMPTNYHPGHEGSALAPQPAAGVVIQVENHFGYPYNAQEGDAATRDLNRRLGRLF